MTIIADILLFAGAIGAAFYCYILSRRLTRFNDLEKGVGGAVAVLSVQVDDMTKALAAAQTTSADAAEKLAATTRRAEDVASRLELLMAASHDTAPTHAEAHGKSVRAVRRRRRSESTLAEVDA